MSTPANSSYLGRLLAQVGERDTMEVLAESAAQVEAAVRRLGPAGLQKAWGAGKWTGAQVLTHLADAEIALAFRSRQILTQSSHTMQEYDESAWMGLYGGEIDVQAALRTFLTVREWNLQLWRRLDAKQLGRVAVHPSRGEETLAVTLRALAGHTLSHLRQLEAIG